MKILSIVAIHLSLLAAVSLAAQAPPAPPAGWTQQVLANGIVLSSPGSDPASRLALTLLPPGRPQGEVKSWFTGQSLALSQAAGRTLAVTKVEAQDGIFVRVVQLENQKQTKIRLVFYGYPTQNGISIAVLMIPPGVEDRDPRIETTNQYVQQIAAMKFEVAAASASATTAAPPAGQMQNSRGQFVGAFGRSDIDLTYHAKSIPAGDRDVPLKGVYLFVGFSFGPSYGGVGTTMTWGQHATQQLLLLFANGVAAKVDLRGGNLAGHHQAEGFATMDVSNPAAVSGAPFGHWIDDGSAIQIQWNYGKPTQLARNGPDLEGSGERWTPYRLADGERLEGTFVRQMEAGLRSQWIVLHKDGTFSGDGVNVTMGGREVNPAFPERGSGTYEVRKGSMILRFTNGFTQAIACTIDTANTGDARTVTLNGFPFQRVR